MCRLLSVGLESKIFSITNLSQVITKTLYNAFVKDLQPANVVGRHPDRDWEKAWKRLDSGVLQPEARDHLFYVLHERVFTRERGFRFLRNSIESPNCIRCEQNAIDSVIHRYSECILVLDAWSTLRNLLERLDQSLCFESDHSLIHLYYLEPMGSNSVLWLIGEYLVYIEREFIFSNRKVSGSGLLSCLRSRWSDCTRIAMPNLEFIPGLFPITGVG